MFTLHMCCLLQLCRSAHSSLPALLAFYAFCAKAASNCHACVMRQNMQHTCGQGLMTDTRACSNYGPKQLQRIYKHLSERGVPLASVQARMWLSCCLRGSALTLHAL